MKNHIAMVLMVAGFLSTNTGCSPIRNFLFGRGARCGLCNRQAPANTAPRTPLFGKCRKGGCFQGNCSQPNQCPPQAPIYQAPMQQVPVQQVPVQQAPIYSQPSSCGCSPMASHGGCGTPSCCVDSCQSGTSYSPVIEDSMGSYQTDPYADQIIGSSIVPGSTVYDDNWVPADRGGSPNYSANYPEYPGTGYKVDKDGARIISEDPLPSGVTPAN